MKNRSLKANFTFHRHNMLPGLLIFWAVMGLVLGTFTLLNTHPRISVGVFMTSSAGGDKVSMIASLFLAILIYTIVIAVSSHPENFSLLTGMGSSRKAYYVSFITSLAIVSLLNATVMTLGFMLEKAVLPMLGLQQLDYLVVYSQQFNNMMLTMVHFFMLTLISSFFVMVSAYFYKSPNKAVHLLIFAAIMITLFTGDLRSGIWGNLLDWMTNNANAFTLSGKLLLLSLVFYSTGWLLVRKSEAR